MGGRAGRFDKNITLDDGKNYIVAIGIDNYRNLPKLPNAVKDVKDVTRILIEDYQFEESNTFFLFNEDATKENIYDYFRKIIQTITPNDSLLIYYSGQGHYDPITEEGYWIPVEGEEGTLSTFIENATILGFINAMKAKHIVVIADSSFSGSLLMRIK